jgi:hypothetical protein
MGRSLLSFELGRARGDKTGMAKPTSRRQSTQLTSFRPQAPGAQSEIGASDEGICPGLCDERDTRLLGGNA